MTKGCIVPHWDDLKFCLALYRHESMSGAAKGMRANVATVSRRIDRLTETIGETIFLRTGNTWAPTARGLQLIELARDFEQKMAQLGENGSVELMPGAEIRISVALNVLQSYWDRFQIAAWGARDKFSLDFTAKPRSLAYSETDLLIGYDRPSHGHFMCAKVGDMEVKPYKASRLDTKPTEWIAIQYDAVELTPRDFDLNLPESPSLRVDGLHLGREFVAHQNAVGFFPVSFAKRYACLEPVDLEGPSVSLEIWMSYHKSRKLDPIVRAAIDIVHQSL